MAGRTSGGGSGGTLIGAFQALGAVIDSVAAKANVLASAASKAADQVGQVQTAARTNMTAGVELDTTHGGHPSGPYSQWHNDHPRMGQDLLAQITRSTR